MADDEAKLLAAARGLPLAERLAHANWKVRAEGLDDIKTACFRAFSSEDKIFAEAGPLLPKAVGDANANVMDKALDTLCAFLEKATEEQAGRLAGPVASTIAAKALKARPATVSKAADACLLLVELECQEAVVEGVCKAWGDKVPKVVIAALDIVKQAVGAFGTKVVDPKPIFAKLPPVFGNSNAGVRDKAKELALELAAYMGSGPIQGALLEKIPDAVKKALEASVAELPAGRRAPERYTRREAAARAAAGPQDMEVDGDAGADVPAAAEAEAEPKADAWEYATPVDILPGLAKAQVKVGDDPSVAFWECWESKKWNVRKGALDAVKDAAKVTRLAPADYGDLVREMKKVLAKDANITCAAVAAEAAGLLAGGLRADFAPYARQLCPAIVERFKEKNIVMSRAAEESLRVMGQHCYSPADVAEDLVAGMVHKNPKARLDTAKLVKDYLEGAPKPAVLKCKDSLLPAAAKLASDADAGIREAAQGVLVVFAIKAGGMGILDKAMAGMDDARKKKIEEMVQAAAKAAPAAAAPAATARAAPAKAARPPPSRTMSSASSAAVSRPSTARGSPKALVPKNGAAGRPGTGAAAKAGGAPVRRAAGGAGAGARTAASGGAGADEDEGSLSAVKLPAEELEARMEALFGGAVLEQLRSAKWQERVEGMDAVAAAVRGLGDEADAQCGVLVQCVAHLPGFGDKNFQVLNKEFELLGHLATAAPSFSKREGFVAMEGLAEKIHELKHKGPVCEALTAVAEAVGPQFVMTQLHKRAAANKNPKVLAEALGWTAQAVEEFGLGALNVMAIIEWMKADLGSANAPVRVCTSPCPAPPARPPAPTPRAPVRNKAMEVLGKCHAQLGGALVGFLDGLKPAQMTALEEHFRQNPKTEVVPTRKVRAAGGGRRRGGGGAGSGGAAAGGGEEAEEAGAPVSVDDLLPRVDISGSITPTLLAMIGSSLWKERLAGVESVGGILAEAGNHIAPGVGELLPALKGRLADSNRNLAAKTLCLLGDLAAAMGPPFDKQARPLLLGPALANLSDNKKQVRDGVLYMLDAWLGVASADKLFPAVTEAVASPKTIVDGKVAGLGWMTTVAADGKAARGADAALKAAAAGAADKAGAVREAATALVAELVRSLGQDAAAQAAASLGGSDKKAASELLTKVGGVAAAAGPPAAAPGRPATAAAAPAARPGTNRPGTRAGAAAAAPAAPAARAAAAAGSAGGAEPAGPILTSAEGKAARSNRFRPRPGRFDGVNAEELDNLQRELAAVASPELQGMLFHRDFKKHLEAADQIVAALPELEAEVAANLDLLLRWASLVKVLEMCRAVLEGLGAHGYQLSEYEAAVFLPAVVEKSGHNQDRVRALHREVLHAACGVYPPARVVDHLAQGLSSKSNRTKIECCEELAAMVERHGMDPLLAARSRPLAGVAALLRERDGATRAAALLAIEQAWAEEGENVWRLLGRLEDRERDMVEEKLKRSSKQPRVRQEVAPPPAPAAEAPRPGAFVPRVPPAAAATPSYQRPPPAAFAADDVPPYAVQRAFTPPAAMETPLLPRPATSYAGGGAGALTPVPGPRPATSPAPACGPAEDPEFDERWAANLVGISATDLSVAVEHMKQLCTDIMGGTDGSATPRMRAVMGASAEQMFAVVCTQLRRVFSEAELQARQTGEQPSSRGCKYALNVMLQGMTVPEVAHGLPQGALRDSISLLLMRLLDDRGLLQFDEGTTLVKAVNVLMLKMLETSNRTYAFAALLQLLREPPGEVTPEMLSKFHDLVVKCLIKLTKSLQQSMEGVDLSALLFNIHDFFLFLGVDEIRKRSSTDDKPLRMVKTILHELCKMWGYGIYAHTEGIPGRNADPQPIIFAYIALNLQTLSQSRLIEGGGAARGPPGAAPSSSGGGAGRGAGADGRGGGGANGSRAAAAAAVYSLSEEEKAEVKAALKDIMGRLMHRGQKDAAMRELYVLRSAHPAYVEKYIASTSDMFQNFIRQELAQLEQEGGEQEVAGPGPGAAPLPPRGLPRPQLSPSASEGALAGGAGASPGAEPEGEAQSGGSAAGRLSALRERMGAMRASGEGGPAPPSTGSSGGRPPSDLSSMRSSIEELQARMQSLRRISQA
eukprot:scaffold13.g367.t1